MIWLDLSPFKKSSQAGYSSYPVQEHSYIVDFLKRIYSFLQHTHHPSANLPYLHRDTGNCSCLLLKWDSCPLISSAWRLVVTRYGRKGLYTYSDIALSLDAQGREGTGRKYWLLKSIWGATAKKGEGNKSGKSVESKHTPQIKIYKNAVLLSLKVTSVIFLTLNLLLK